MNYLPIIIAIVGLLGLVVTAVFYFMWKKSTKSNGLLDSSSAASQFNFDEYMQKSYVKSIQIPIVKRMVTNVRTKLETLAVYDEYKLRKEVMRIVFSIVTVIMFILLLLLLFQPSWLVVFWIFIGILFLVGVLMDFFVYRVEAKLLKQLKEFNSQVSASYLETKMVDESVFEAIQVVGPEMKIQAEHIHRILTSIDPEEELAKYDEVAPIRFLKMIAGICVTVKDQGDVILDNGRSTFIAGIATINQELNADILYRQKLSQRLKGVAIVTLIPVFLALPLQNWGINTFPIMKNFFDSRIGFMSGVLAYGISLFSYLMIRKMGEINEAKYNSSIRRFKWEEWAIKNIPLLDKFLKGFTPGPHTKQYFKLSKLLKDANSPLKIEWLTLQRIVFSLLAFLLFIGGLWFAGEREVRNTLYNVLPQSAFSGNVSAEEYQIHQETAAFDRQVLDDIGKMKATTPDSVQGHIAVLLGLEPDDKRVEDATKRVIGKWMVVENSFVKWWEVLLIIILAGVVWFIPVWILQFQRSLRLKDMENEVHQFLLIIIILRNFDRMNVYSILEWMERFGVVFKEPIQATMQLYDAGPEEALEYLNDQVTFEGFNQILRRLKLSIVRISIKEAFDDIEMEKEFYMEQRNEANYVSLLKKGNMANFLGMAPMVSLVFLYLVFPLVYMSITETQELMTKF